MSFQGQPVRPRPTRLWPVLLALWLAGGSAAVAAEPPPAESPPAESPPAESPPAKYAGTYRIESWQSLEASGIHQFFYLHPSGVFVLAAEWPGNESSRFVGEWSVNGDRLYLEGRGDVKTYQGAWRTPFTRTYRISVLPNGFQLSPVLGKNRYGLMGWPEPYRYYRPQPAPNLPGAKIPAEADALLAWIKARLAGKNGK
jgi:hypothetical protein